MTRLTKARMKLLRDVHKMGLFNSIEAGELFAEIDALELELSEARGKALEEAAALFDGSRAHSNSERLKLEECAKAIRALSHLTEPKP